MPVSELNRIERIWLAIEDGLLLSSPEAFLLEDGAYVKTTFRWVVSTLVSSGYQEMLRNYKAFITFVKAKAIKANVMPKPPSHFPGFTPEGGYRELGLEWLDRVIRRGLKSKGETTRLAHFISTRGLPPPTGEMIQDSLRKHRINLATPAASIPKERIEVVRLLSTKVEPLRCYRTFKHGYQQAPLWTTELSRKEGRMRTL